MFTYKLPVVYILPCKVITGFLGGYLLLIGIVHALSCDAMSAAEKSPNKAVWFVVLEAQVFIGQLVGPFAAGRAIDDLATMRPY